MSVSGISSSNLFDYSNQSIRNNVQKFRQEFQQLGQDLQSGNLSAAQSDFATLQQLAPQNSSSASASSSSSSSPLAQAFNQLSQDLQVGNLSGAQQDFATIQQDFQSQAGKAQGHHHHHHHHDGDEGGSSAIGKLFSQLGQALQSGNLSSAQQAYNSIMQDFQGGQGNGQSSSQQSTQSGISSVSVNA